MDITIISLIIMLPICFIVGWFLGRIDMKALMKQAKQIPQRIFDGVDALVENKTGVARDELKEVIEQEPHIIDLQFSLGRLYRKRGENDLAIKLHSKLLRSQFVLSDDVKDKIRLELAKDFQKAGLIDRSESTLKSLLNSEFYSHQALEMLLLIYQQDKNWQEAIETARKLATSDIAFHTEVAQFYCELAEENMIKSDFNKAEANINLSLDTNKKCVRANMLLGELYFNQERYNEAIEIWQKIEKQNYLYVPFVVNKMFNAYQQIGKLKEFLNLIKGYAKLYPELNMHQFVYKVLSTHDTHEAAVEYLRSAISHKPNAQIAALLIEARTDAIVTPEGRLDATKVKDILNKYNDKYSQYSCGCCNFKSKTFFWQCPACYSWESISPNNAES